MSVVAEWQARWDPDRIASIGADGVRVTYGELGQRVARARGLLRGAEVRRGDVVALAMPKDPAFLELVLAAMSIGAVALPLNDRYTRRELEHTLGDARARFAVLPPDAGVRVTHGNPLRMAYESRAVRELLDAAKPAEAEPSVPDDAPALLLYTSGTTGKPKGAPATHANLRAAVDALHGAWAWSGEDVLLHALPQYHVHGLVVAAFGALRAGATTIWLDRFDAEDVVARLAAGPATVFMGVPTFYTRMLDATQPTDLRRVRLMTSGSAALPATVHRAVAERFGVQVVERYGMTEIGIVISNPIDGPRPGSIGRPLPGVEVRIADADGREVAAGQVGELRIRGPSVFSGYLGDPTATAEVLRDGWMSTGDLGSADADGWITLSGRKSELVIVGGLNVYPAEVEAALLACPGVREAAVVGVADADLGEVPVAAIVGTTDPADLRERLRADLAPYKIPRRITIVDALPRNAMGKVDKRALADQLAPRRFPLADEVGAVRAAFEEALRAQTDLVDLRVGGAAAVAARWPDVAPAELEAVLSAHAGRLHGLGERLHAALHRQAHLVDAPEFDALRTEVGALRQQLAGVARDYGDAVRRAAVLGPLEKRLRESLGDDRLAPALAAMATEAAGLVGVTIAPAGGAGDADAVARVAAQVVAEAARAAGEAVALAAERAQVEAALRERTG